MNKAILHFDGDSFFASVEQVMNYRLRHKPIVTGGEKGAITSVSIEAKRKGVGRGLTLRQARMLCPDLIVVSSDFTSYSIFAHRMYDIVRRYTDEVEEYSIDECFADITDLDKELGKSYEEIALMIQKELEASLGLTFGVGLAPNKVLAKVASKHRKPGGFTHIYEKDINTFLKDMPVGKIWGIGSASSIQLNKLGIYTALDLASKTESWLIAHDIAKPHKEIWYELQGKSVKTLSVSSNDEDIMGSIIKSRTFSPPSSEREYLLSQLSKNIENACIKARRHGVKARHIRFYLKTQSFTYRSFEISLDIPLSTPIEIIRLAEKNFDAMYEKGILYRATGISLSGIVPENVTSNDLFGKSNEIKKTSTIFSVVDAMSKRFGKHTLFLGSSLSTLKKDDRGEKIIDLPFLGKVR